MTKENTIRLLDELVAEKFDTSLTQKSKKAKKKRSVKEIEKEKHAEIRNRHHISVIGKNVPAPVEFFEDFKEHLKLSSIITKNLISSGYDAPTPIQMQTVPLMLQVRIYFPIKVPIHGGTEHSENAETTVVKWSNSLIGTACFVCLVLPCMNTFRVRTCMSLDFYCGREKLR